MTNVSWWNNRYALGYNVMFSYLSYWDMEINIKLPSVLLKLSSILVDLKIVVCIMIQSMHTSFTSNLVPMNKIKVGMTQSPNIKQVRSKVRKIFKVN